MVGDIVVVEKTNVAGDSGTTNEKGTMRSFVCTTGGDSSAAAYSEKENTFNADLITANTIGSNKLISNAITARELDVNAITADHIGAGVVTAQHIAAGSITADQISSTTKIEVFTPDPSAEVLIPISGTYAALDGTHESVRIHAGGTGANPATAPFRVLGTGQVIATNISLQKTDGTEFFNSSEGFVDGAFAQIAAETGTRVSRFGETFTGNIGNSEANDTNTYEKITIDQNLSLQQTLKFDVSQFGKTADVEFHGDSANPLILNITNGSTPLLSDITKADGSTAIGRAPKNGEFIRLNFTNVQAVNTGGLIGGSSGLFWAPEGFLNADGTALVSSFPFFTALTIISVPTGNSTVLYKVNHTGNNRLYFNFVSGGSGLSRLNTDTQALTNPTIDDFLNGIELELLTRPTFSGNDTKIIDTGDNSIGGDNSFSFEQTTSTPTSGINANRVYVLESSSQTINSSGIPVKRLTKEPILGVGAVSSEGFVSRSVTTSYSGTAGTPVIKYYHSKCFTTFGGGSATDKSTTSRQFSVNTTTSGSGFLLASSGQATTSAQNIDLTNIIGNIGLSGTVDGRDVAADGTKLDGIAAGANVGVPTVKANQDGTITTATSNAIQLIAGNNITISEVGSAGNYNFSATGLLPTAGGTITTDNKIKFRDDAIHISSSADGQLDIVADTEVQIDTSTLDINANIYLSGSIASASSIDCVALGTDSNASIGGNLDVSGDATVGDDLSLDSDAAVLNFGANSEIKVIHAHNSGLNFKHTATADDKPFTLTLQTGETDIAADDVLGVINFQAPDEATGTDAILVAAGIAAVSEGDFSAANNATKLSFRTGASETATEKMSLSSAGNLSLSGTVDGRDVAADGTKLDGIAAGANVGVTGLNIASGRVITGSGSNIAGNANLTYSNTTGLLNSCRRIRSED